MFPVKRKEITSNEFFLGTKGVWLYRGFLKLVIKDTKKCEVEAAQGFPLLFNQDQKRNLLVGISRWGPVGRRSF